MNKRKLKLDKELLTSSNHPAKDVEGGTAIICTIIKVIEISLELTTIGDGGDGGSAADCPPPYTHYCTPGSCNGPGTCGGC